MVILALGFRGLGMLCDCRALAGVLSYSRVLPLTIRSELTRLFGRSLEGPLGHIIDIVSVMPRPLVCQHPLGTACHSLVAGCIMSATWGG
jgi:choline-glycine betaine transporter